MANKRLFLLITVLLPLMVGEISAEDIVSRYGMPPIKRVFDGSVANNILKKAKVLNYTESMPVKYTEVMDTESFVNVLRVSIQKQVKTADKIVYFDGKTTSELNNFIKNISIVNMVEVILTESDMVADEPIMLRSNTIINGSSIRLDASSVDIAIIGENVENIGLKNIVIDHPHTCGIMFINTRKCSIDNIQVLNSDDRGLVARGQSSYICITHSQFKENKRSGILLQDGSHHNLIMHCDVFGGKDSSNWSAGIVITSVPSVSEYGIRDAFDDSYFYPKDLSFKNGTAPYKNIIEASHVHNNQSSGIYIDGGNGNAVVGNYLTNNDKEGLCLDFYSVANIVESNIFTGNGFRRLQSDDDLGHDSVLHFGRLADGSAASKLPNISLDNAAYNVIIRNTISGAAGDGIKIVRSGFRNIFGLNSITDNSSGENSRFSFYGVLLGSAGSDVEGDTSGLDYFPSLGNIIFGNTIYGAHSDGILLDSNSIYNDVYDNMIMKQKKRPLTEKDQPNSIVGNNFNSIENSIHTKKFSRKFVVFLVMISALLSAIIAAFTVKCYTKYNKRKV